jgi:hypothetical protein
MSPILNPANDTNDRPQVHKVWRALYDTVLPETILVFYCITGSDVREEDSLVLRLMDLEGFREVELNHTLKLPEKGFLDEILRFVVASVAINKAFVLQ